MTAIAGKPPGAGSIVWCYFPYPPPASSVRHPCLVLSVENDEHGNVYLIVAGGTSTENPEGGKRRVYPCDLVANVGESDFQAKTLKSTKFSLAEQDILALPYTKDYFYVGPGQAWPKVGALNLAGEKTKERYSEICTHTDVKATVLARKAELASKEKDADKEEDAE